MIIIQFDNEIKLGGLCNPVRVSSKTAKAQFLAKIV